jgi:hypothetical protein
MLAVTLDKLQVEEGETEASSEISGSAKVTPPVGVPACV